ncbi:MAG: hypothetical protein IPL23_21280 [Saprospiraceae bacterium]|nr:hypothetical protein [Saprospiraceae bacterium]MBK8636421.1 hypothetical protein [Saprospiraceae bacterium]HMS68823.1 hypothetical protein [Saprospiraceae bacterium]
MAYIDIFFDVFFLIEQYLKAKLMDKFLKDAINEAKIGLAEVGITNAM